ncbi:hypothetical protein ATO13_22026 [Stappia sp. 22II-S9-Z10]|nr:hypothetical protein ATO13_22026 [Stappia sp. 22II-S9-Z10]
MPIPQWRRYELPWTRTDVTRHRVGWFGRLILQRMERREIRARWLSFETKDKHIGWEERWVDVRARDADAKGALLRRNLAEVDGLPG